jgi:hypothetical protein
VRRHDVIGNIGWLTAQSAERIASKSPSAVIAPASFLVKLPNWIIGVLGIVTSRRARMFGAISRIDLVGTIAI